MWSSTTWWDFGLFVIIITFLGGCRGGYIPPGPKYKCPPLVQIWPCRCLNSTDLGLTLQCEDVSLATLSAGISYIAKNEIPVETLRLQRLNAEFLHGPVFEGFNMSHLIIEDSSVGNMASDVFYAQRHSLKEIDLFRLNISEFPHEAFQGLFVLESVTIHGHSISNLSVSVSGLDGLKALRISEGNLSLISKSTFSSLGKLTRLDLHGNHLTDLPKDALQQLKNLEFLDLAYNNFTKLEPNYFQHLTKLTWFNGSHNSIPEFRKGAFARNNFLRVIHLTHNQITKLDPATFRGMRLLRRLYLGDNQITDIGRSTFDSINKIGTIDLARNRLKVIDYQMFKGLIQAEVIDVSNNQIREIKREAFYDLSYVHINLSHNEISDIERNSFINCVNITLLDLSHNHITNITRGTFDENSYPTEFRLDFNYLKSLGDVPLKFFHGIKILNVSNNELEEVPKNTFPKLYELHTLDLSRNNLSKIHPAIFSTLFSLRHLDLSSNNLTILRGSTIGTIPTLLDINLHHNLLSSVSSSTFTQLPSLRWLDVSHNELKSVFQVPPSLSSLDVSVNKIATLTKAWPVMNSLLKLDLSWNKLGGQLDGESFSNLGSLQELNLQGNNITDIPVEALSAVTVLQRLDLSQNTLSILRKRALGHLPVLFKINFSSNLISLVEPKAFEGLLQLLEINLSANNLSVLPVGSLSGLVSLRVLNLSRNAIEKTDNGSQCIFEENLSLEILDLSHNGFVIVTPLTFPSKQWTPYRLSHVDLSHNFLNIITKDFLIGTSKLISLNLESNRIAEIRQSVLGNFSNLEMLNLKDNLIGFLDEKSLGPPPRLRNLNLAGNKLRRFPVKVLKKAPFEILDLRSNGLVQFEPEFLAKIESNGSRILLNENPLKCDCRLILLMRFFSFYRPSLSNMSAEFYTDYLNFTCVPGEIKDPVQLHGLQEAELICDYKKDYLAPEIEPSQDLEIRNIEINGTYIQIRWRVLSKEDISGFDVSLRGSNSDQLRIQRVRYSKRTIQLPIQPGTRSVCISPYTISGNGIQDTYRLVCQDLNARDTAVALSSKQQSIPCVLLTFASLLASLKSLI